WNSREPANLVFRRKLYAWSIWMWLKSTPRSMHFSIPSLTSGPLLFQTMNWEMMAAVGQLAAVIIGIPSLIYLAIHIRAQTKERRQSAVNALTVQWTDLTRSLESPEFAPIYLRGVQSFDNLDSVSKLRFSAFLNRFFKSFESMYFSHRDHIL